jgi:hypothetical protein
MIACTWGLSSSESLTQSIQFHPHIDAYASLLRFIDEQIISIGLSINDLHREWANGLRAVKNHLDLSDNYFLTLEPARLANSVSLLCYLTHCHRNFAELSSHRRETVHLYADIPQAEDQSYFASDVPLSEEPRDMDIRVEVGKGSQEAPEGIVPERGISVSMLTS